MIDKLVKNRLTLNQFLASGIQSKNLNGKDKTINIPVINKNSKKQSPFMTFMLTKRHYYFKSKTTPSHLLHPPIVNMTIYFAILTCKNAINDWKPLIFGSFRIGMNVALSW